MPCPNTDGLPDLGRDRVVVVHRVEVARRARVLHEHRARERRELFLRFSSPHRRLRRHVVPRSMLYPPDPASPTTARGGAVDRSPNVTRASIPRTLRRWPAKPRTAGAEAARAPAGGMATDSTADCRPTVGAPARQPRAAGPRAAHHAADSSTRASRCSRRRGTTRPASTTSSSSPRRRTAPSTSTSRTRKTCSAALAAEVADQMQTLAEDRSARSRPGPAGPRRRCGSGSAGSPTSTSSTAPVIRAWTEAEIGSHEFGRLGNDVLARFTRVLTERIAAAAPPDLDPVDRRARARRDVRTAQLLRARRTGARRARTTSSTRSRS